MSSFKIYGRKEKNENNVVILDGKFSDFKDYNQLKRKLIERSQKKNT